MTEKMMMSHWCDRCKRKVAWTLNNIWHIRQKHALLLLQNNITI